MGGLAILLSVLAYAAVAVVVVRKIESRGLKVVAGLVALVLPTTDAVVGRLYLNHMCSAEGGLKVFKTIEGVNGFYNDVTGRPYPSWITKHGYRFVEGKDFDGRPMRIGLGPENQLVEEKNVSLQSKYVFEELTTESAGGFIRSEQRVRELETGDVLARYVNITYKGGWAERALGSFSDAGGSFGGACFVGAARTWPGQIVTRTLRPPKAKSSRVLMLPHASAEEKRGGEEGRGESA